MLGVECGPDRYPVDAASLNYWPNADLWKYPCVGGDFVVRGDAAGPDPVRFDFARRVAANIDAFVAEANMYLAAFVVPERFQAFGPWEFQGAEFGRHPDDVNEFELLMFLGDDIYGLWGVRFRYSPNADRCYARQFRRLQE